MSETHEFLALREHQLKHGVEHVPGELRVANDNDHQDNHQQEQQDNDKVQQHDNDHQDNNQQERQDNDKVQRQREDAFCQVVLMVCVVVHRVYDIDLIRKVQGSDHKVQKLICQVWVI